jgi:hypothetical protein
MKETNKCSLPWALMFRSLRIPTLNPILSFPTNANDNHPLFYNGLDFGFRIRS